MNCQYVYDFGDHWVHTVRFRQRVTSAHHFQRRLLAGRRAGPHEDSGGIGGYSRLVEFLATGEDPWGDDPEELAAWIGEWRPDNFALADVRNTFEALPGFVWFPSDAGDAAEVFTPAPGVARLQTTWRRRAGVRMAPTVR